MFLRNPRDCAGFPACLCFQFCLSFVAVMLEGEYITCMKFLNSHSLTLNIGQIYHYWLLLFSRLSKLEKEASNCLDSGTQTEQEEEESSEAVSTCPCELRFNNIQLTCGQQPQGLNFNLHSGTKGQLSCTGYMKVSFELSNPYLRGGSKLHQPPKKGEIGGQELGKHSITPGIPHCPGHAH